MSFISSYNGSSILISACISNYDEDENATCPECCCCSNWRHDHPMSSQAGPLTLIPGLQQLCLAPALSRLHYSRCDGLSRSLAGFVVNCHKKVFTQFVRRAETDERQETDTRMTRVLTQLSTRLSPLHFTGKVAIIPHTLLCSL